MDWQATFAWIATTCAGAYIAWRMVRTLRPNKTGCAGSCGCAKATTNEIPGQAAIIPPEKLVLRQKPSCTAD